MVPGYYCYEVPSKKMVPGYYCYEVPSKKMVPGYYCYEVPRKFSPSRCFSLISAGSKISGQLQGEGARGFLKKVLYLGILYNKNNSVY